MPALKASRIQTVKSGKLVSFKRIGYAAWKAAHGLRPVRDLIGDGSQGGHVWDSFSVRSVSETLVRMAFTQKHQREKALATKGACRSSRFLRKIAAEASRIFKINVQSLGVMRCIAILAHVPNLGHAIADMRDAGITGVSTSGDGQRLINPRLTTFWLHGVRRFPAEGARQTCSPGCQTKSPHARNRSWPVCMGRSNKSSYQYLTQRPSAYWTARSPSRVGGGFGESLLEQ